MNEKFLKWLDGDDAYFDQVLDSSMEGVPSRETLKAERRAITNAIVHSPRSRRAVAAGSRTLRYLYYVVAVLSAVILIGVLLYCVSGLPRYGQENVRADEVVERYVEHGLEETGAVNVVAGMILDYRAFDTLGESHVLFTALICVMILLRRDRKNMDSRLEDYYRVVQERYFDTSGDEILQGVGLILVPCIFLFGIYILLNGHLSPGGGFSGGAVMGAGMIIFCSACGFERVDRFFTLKLSSWITFAALSFYSFAKGYVFITGANHLENHIPKGTPGAILSAGLILPLDIAVGIVVACTMFGFYSLFRRGSIGGN